MTSFGDKSFSIIGPHVWNTLPLSLQQDINYRQLSPNYKHFCFGVRQPRCIVGTLDASVDHSHAVTITDVGQSDYHLLQWSIPAARSLPPVKLVQTRPWRKLIIDDL